MGAPVDLRVKGRSTSRLNSPRQGFSVVLTLNPLLFKIGRMSSLQYRIALVRDGMKITDDLPVEIAGPVCRLTNGKLLAAGFTGFPDGFDTKRADYNEAVISCYLGDKLDSRWIVRRNSNAVVDGHFGEGALVVCFGPATGYRTPAIFN